MNDVICKLLLNKNYELNVVENGKHFALNRKSVLKY